MGLRVQDVLLQINSREVLRLGDVRVFNGFGYPESFLLVVVALAALSGGSEDVGVGAVAVLGTAVVVEGLPDVPAVASVASRGEEGGLE